MLQLIFFCKFAELEPCPFQYQKRLLQRWMVVQEVVKVEVVRI